MATTKRNQITEQELPKDLGHNNAEEMKEREAATTPEESVGKNEKEAIGMINNTSLPQNEKAEKSNVTRTNSPEKDSSEKGILNLEICKEYRKYLESSDKSMRASGKYPPKDALSLRDLSIKPIGEVCDLANRMSVTPNKSDLLVMYANGFSFSWTEMQTAAEVLGLKKEAENTKSPKFYIPDDYDAPQSVKKKKTIYIDHGKRPSTVERKITLSGGTNDLLNSLFGSLSNLIQSKILDVLIKESLENIAELNDNGLLDVKYRPLPEESIAVGSIRMDRDK